MLSSGGKAASGNVRRALSLPASCGPSAALVPGINRIHKKKCREQGGTGGLGCCFCPHLPLPRSPAPTRTARGSGVSQPWDRQENECPRIHFQPGWLLDWAEYGHKASRGVGRSTPQEGGVLGAVAGVGTHEVPGARCRQDLQRLSGVFVLLLVPGSALRGWAGYHVSEA